LRAQYLRTLDPDSFADDDDPLNEESSTWASLRADEALRAEIALDVERCMPESTYFRDPHVQRMLGDALFVWCRSNPSVGYRQGMHEVVAMCVWVVEREAVETAEGQVREVLDVRFVESDVWALFERIMRSARAFYEPGKEEGESEMILRAQRVFYELLPRVDPEVAAHLRAVDVIPQIFLMRWVRLLFGREFPFQDVLEMWDLLFSFGQNLELVDYVCVAMILRLRWERKLDRDYSSIYLTFSSPRGRHKHSSHLASSLPTSPSRQHTTLAALRRPHLTRLTNTHHRRRPRHISNRPSPNRPHRRRPRHTNPPLPLTLRLLRLITRKSRDTNFRSGAGRTIPQ
jgi:TBC1 domain family member 5